MNPHTPKTTPILGDGVPVDFQNFKEWLQGSKLNGLWNWKALGMQMSKMGSHYSFGHLKHKLWPKEGPGVKLAIWLPITKNQESTQFTWLQRACDIPLESFQQKLQLCFRSKVCSQSNEALKSWESHLAQFWDFHLGVLGEKNHLDVSSVASHRVYYKGEGGGFLQVWAMVSLVYPCYPWLVLAPRVFQLCTNHFVWVMCRPMRVSEAC
jgi:hypothetical protein